MTNIELILNKLITFVNQVALICLTSCWVMGSRSLFNHYFMPKTSVKASWQPPVGGCPSTTKQYRNAGVRMRRGIDL